MLSHYTRITVTLQNKHLPFHWTRRRHVGAQTPACWKNGQILSVYRHKILKHWYKKQPNTYFAQIMPSLPLHKLFRIILNDLTQNLTWCKFKLNFICSNYKVNVYLCKCVCRTNPFLLKHTSIRFWCVSALCVTAWKWSSFPPFHKSMMLTLVLYAFFL